MKKNYIITLFFLGVFNILNSQDVEIQGNAIITGSVEVMDTILFSDGSQLASACLELLQDADGDTKISVEQATDSDQIVFTSDGEVVAILDKANLTLMHKTNSIFIGEKAGSSDDGKNKNIFIGNQAGKENISGSGNLYIGQEAGLTNTTGVQNTQLGFLSGSISTGANNTFLGSYSGFSTDGNQNTILGHQAGETLDGSRNTVIGASAGANAKGSGNVIIGADAGKGSVGNDLLIIHNDDSNEPMISGNFNTLDLNINAETEVEKNLSVKKSLQLLNQNNVENNAILLGQNNEANFAFSTFQTTPPFPNAPTLNRLEIGYIQSGNVTNLISMNNAGRIGIGTLGPQTKLHVSSSSSFGHIMKLENTSPGIEGDGLEIKLNRPTNGAGNNFITFTDQDGVAGRIEGFNVAENITFAQFPDIDFSNYFDILQIQNFAFSPGSLPTISGGQLPFLSGGSFPTLNPGLFPTFNPGQFPTLTGGTIGSFDLNANFNFDAIFFNIACGPACANPREIYTFNPSWTGFSFPSLNGGQLPTLSGGQLPTLSGGSFPTLNRGQLPTISGGSLPSINFDLVFNPTPILGAFDDLKEVMCWAIENGERSLLTTNPQDLKMMQDISYLNNLADCKNGGVTYGSGGADYAEYLERDDKNEVIKAGQIVGVKGGRISKDTKDAEQLLVVSMMPVVLGNMPENVDSVVNYEKVAFLGQAPVWVVGDVISGDYIIPSGNNDGYGIAVSPSEITLKHLPIIVGRAWSEGHLAVNLVNMAIGLKTNEISLILELQNNKMNEFEERLAQLESSSALK